MKLTLKRPSLFTLLLIAYIALASLYSVTTPIFEASDEVWHYPFVQYLATHGLSLPVQSPDTQTDFRQEGSQPPLYYMISAVMTSWIDTSDLDKVRNINPHADIGVVVPDGNYNMIVHDPALESFPWRGTVLALHLVRFFSVILGAVTVAMTYLLTLELFPDKRWLALAAAAFTAFNPMFLFISGSVNNDNLSNALASVLLVMIVRLLKRNNAPPIRTLIAIGVIAGAGMLAKFNIGFLLPLIALALALLSYRLRDWRPLIVGGAITGGLTVLIAAWWYIRNAQLYGDVTGLNMFISIVGPRTIPANLAQLWSERHTFLMSYWGFFGGVNVPLPDVVYTVFNGVAALAVIGLAVAGVRWIIAKPWAKATGLNIQSPVGANTKPEQPADQFPLATKWRGGQGVRITSIWLGRAVTVIWIVLLFVSLLRWTSATWASQGRLMFSAIAPLSLWMAYGLWQLGRSVPLVRWRVVTVGLAWFVCVAAFGALAIERAYADPTQFKRVAVNDAPRFVEFSEPGRHFVNIGFLPVPYEKKLSDRTVHVGDYLQFCEYPVLETQPFTRDWTVFIHLENPDGVIVAQRDVYLGQGRLATTFIQKSVSPLISWCNLFAVPIPVNAYAPQKLDVVVGFYDLKTGDRMIATDWDNEQPIPDNRVVLGTVQLLPRDSTLGVPNPMSVNFGGETELVGYDVSSLVEYPDEKVTVTLYWREQHPLTTDYRVFTQILEPNTTHVFGGDDSMPAAWSRPTTTWKPGEIIKDAHTFTIHADAPPGTWQIAVGMYKPTPDGGFQRLRVITPDGGEADDYVYLSRVKINAPAELF